MRIAGGQHGAAFVLPVFAIAIAAGMAAGYGADPGALWRDPYHDRNSHFAAALNIALALREGRFEFLAAEIAAPSVWPPLQALLLGVWMAVAGPALDWAILPALLGWIGTMFGLALICARAAPDPPRAAAAAGMAVALALASPAFARLGADAMMETPGAALTMLVLATAVTRPGSWRGLALLLTLLALHKYNYWAMAAAALVIAGAPDVLRWAARCLAAVDRNRLREDAALRLAVLLLAAAAVLLPQDPPWRIAGILLLPAHVACLAWGVALFALARAWRRRGKAFDAALGDPARKLLAWHALPVALWLAIPGKLPALLWFLSPTHRGATAPHGLPDALAFHWDGFARGFSAHPVVAAGILALALLGARRAPRALTAFAAIGIVAVVLHPQLQWRFQATILPAIWALAGLGTATLVARAGSVAGVAAPGLVAAVLLALPAPPLADAAAIRRPDGPRDLDLIEAWRDLPVTGDGVLVLSGIGRSDLFTWSIRLRCGCLMPVEQPPWLALGDTAARAALDGTAAPWLLAITMPAPYPLAGRAEPLALPVGAMLADQSRFVRAETRGVASHGAEIAFWRAVAPPAAPPPRRRGLIEMAAALLALATVATLLWPSRPGRAGSPPCASG